MAYYDATTGKSVTTTVGQAAMDANPTGFVSFVDLAALFSRAQELYPGEKLLMFSVGSTGIAYAVKQGTLSVKREGKVLPTRHKRKRRRL